MKRKSKPGQLIVPEDLQSVGNGFRRRGKLTARYVWLLGRQCANPGCEYGANVEGHHITPYAKGGADAYWNIVALCFHCHRYGHLHSRSDQRRMELNYWKALHERRVLGFYMDEHESGFYDRLAVAWNRQAALDRAEKATA